MTLSGTNWTAGSTVHLVVDDDKSDAWTHTADVAAGVDGKISDSFSLAGLTQRDVHRHRHRSRSARARPRLSAPASASATEPYLVRFASGTSTATQAQILASAGARGHQLHRSAPHPWRPAPRRRRPQTSHRQAALVPERRPASSQTARATPERTPERPGYGDQWSLPKIGWDNVFGSVSPSGSAIVAVLDTGVDGSHPDLDGNARARHVDPRRLERPDATRTATARRWRASSPPRRTTARASPASATPASASCRSPCSAPTAPARTATSSRASSTRPTTTRTSSSCPSRTPATRTLLQAAIDYAWENGVVLVAATGNDGSSRRDFPAGDRGVIGVSNTDQSDALTARATTARTSSSARPATGIVTTSAGGGYGIDHGDVGLRGGGRGRRRPHQGELGRANGVIVSRLARNAEAGARGADRQRPPEPRPRDRRHLDRLDPARRRRSGRRWRPLRRAVCRSGAIQLRRWIMSVSLDRIRQLVQAIRSRSHSLAGCSGE